MGCELCEIVAGEGKAVILHEDDQTIVAIRDHVLTPGQVTVFPRQHFPILEMAPESLLGRCALVANAVSIALFERLGAKGTNILVRNGLGAGQVIPHLALEVIPRQEGDGLALQWEPKQLMEDEMERTFTLLTQEVRSLREQQSSAVVNAEKSPPSLEKDKETVAAPKTEGEHANYLLKSVRRIP